MKREDLIKLSAALIVSGEMEKEARVRLFGTLGTKIKGILGKTKAGFGRIKKPSGNIKKVVTDIGGLGNLGKPAEVIRGVTKSGVEAVTKGALEGVAAGGFDKLIKPLLDNKGKIIGGAVGLGALGIGMDTLQNKLLINATLRAQARRERRKEVKK